MEVVKGSKSKKKEKRRHKVQKDMIREDYEENDSDDYLNYQNNQL